VQRPSHEPAATDHLEPLGSADASDHDAADPLDALRAELASLGERPVNERVSRFEHANVVLAEALAELDEV
jgi:hypothetical protein